MLPSLKKGVFVARSQGHLVFLDSVSGKYYVFDHENCTTFFYVMCSGKKLKDLKGKELIFFKKIEELNLVHMAKNSTTQAERLLKEVKSNAGLSNFKWNIPFPEKKHVRVLSIFAFIVRLIQVNFILKNFGMHSLIESLEGLKEKKCSRLKHKICYRKLDKEVSYLKYASFFYPQITKCLEWSACLATKLWKKNIHVDFNIGVQALPFFAHAWLSFNGEPLFSQDKEAHENLSIIYTTAVKR